MISNPTILVHIQYSSVNTPQALGGESLGSNPGSPGKQLCDLG